MIVKRVCGKIYRIFIHIRNSVLFESFGKNSVIKRPIRILGKKYINIGKNVTILEMSRIEAIDMWNGKKMNPCITIEDNCDIGQGLHLTACNSVHIHKNTLIAPYVYITDVMHDYDALDLPILQQGVHVKPTEIGEDCWIGIGVKIFSGVHIGKHCIIGANSVVITDIEDYSVAVGSPARVIKKYSFSNKKWERINL